jgi:zinc transporter ZupT
MIILIAIAAFLITYLGGLFVLKFRDRLHLILGFSAGAIIGVAFFDLLPEALELGSGFYSLEVITSMIALGFILYMLLDRVIFLHGHEEENCDNHGHIKQKGIIGAGSVSMHSFLDGIAVGLVLQTSTVVGAMVAAAVLVHNFSDGVNTVNLILKNGGDKKKAMKWLTVDALAPALGILSSFFFTLPEKSLGIVFALFCGFFLYIGASDLLPESHHSHSTKWTTAMTILGIVVMYVAIRFSSL